MQHALLPPNSRMAKLNEPKTWVSYALILTVCTTVIVKSEDNCLRCEDLNRETPTNKCPKNVKECGKCIKGMMPVSWDISCIPFDLKILENPANTTCTIGKSVILKCRINEAADCEWRREESIINVNQAQEHYRYISYKNDIPTKTCDLEIISCRTEDSGWWECRTRTEYDKARSSKARLTSSRQLMILGHPLHAIAQLNKEVILNCKFNLPVQCEWVHKGKPVHMKKGVYQYIDKSDSSKREDCSIRISSFKKKDAGDWQCRNVPTSTDPMISSNKAVLYDSKSKPGQCPKVGEKLILHCYLGQPGECSWQRNKSVVKIANRYQYIFKSENATNASDCSFIIEKFTKMDAATWQCGSNSNDSADGTFEYKTTPCISKGPSKPTKKGKQPKPKKKGKPSKRSISPLANTLTFPIAHPQVEKHPLSGNYYLGDNITLQCKFNKPISECFWLRNDHNVDIEHRYQYMGNKNGQNTADCSMTIQGLQQIDLGSWICGSVADDQHNGVLSKTSFLDAINLDDSSDEWDESEDNSSDEWDESEDNSSDEWDESEDTEIIFIPEDEPVDSDKEDSWIENNIRATVEYLSVAVLVLAIIIVLLLTAIIYFWCTRSRHSHEVNEVIINRTKNKYMPLNDIAVIKEEEMYTITSPLK